MISLKNTPSLVVHGGINMDVIGITQTIPESGQTVVGQESFFSAGGKGANQSVAIARLGAKVSLIGVVGEDYFGPILLEGLQKEGVDISAISTDQNTNSGLAIILLDSERENRILVIPGANLNQSNLEFGSIESKISKSSYVLLQGEIDQNASIKTAETARKHAVKVVLDPAPAENISKELLNSSDIITPNQAEASSITGIDVIDVQSAKEACQALLGFGPSVAITTIGDMGAYYISSSGEQGHINAFKTEVVDSVAAGDAFNGSLTVSLANGTTLQQAVHNAVAAGSLATTVKGAQGSMPTADQVKNLIAKGKHS